MQTALPPIVRPLALGVAPPSSLSGALAAPEPEALTGEERKNSGDCVDVVCSLWLRGVAWGPRCEAWDASECSCSSGPAGAGLLDGTWEFRAPLVLLRGVAEAEVRCERRCAGEDMVASASPALEQMLVRVEGSRGEWDGGKETRK
jgi:hypothetical protein